MKPVASIVGNTNCYLQIILGPNSEEAIDKKREGVLGKINIRSVKYQVLLLDSVCTQNCKRSTYYERRSKSSSSSNKKAATPFLLESALDLSSI